MDTAKFLETPLPEHPDLHRGTLKTNGLRYVVLPNKVPPQRFEAHLEMHVGSVDENERQQGLAHLVEHVTFLGSRKKIEQRERKETWRRRFPSFLVARLFWIRGPTNPK